MTAATFNPPAARDLEAAGIERGHADAVAEGMRPAVGAGRKELAARADLEALEARVTAMLYRASWNQGAGIVAILAASGSMPAGAGLRFLPIRAIGGTWRRSPKP